MGASKRDDRQRYLEADWRQGFSWRQTQPMFRNSARGRRTISAVHTTAQLEAGQCLSVSDWAGALAVCNACPKADPASSFLAPNNGILPLKMRHFGSYFLPFDKGDRRSVIKDGKWRGGWGERGMGRALWDFGRAHWHLCTALAFPPSSRPRIIPAFYHETIVQRRQGWKV